MTNKSKEMYIVLICSTYGYFYKNISYVVPMGTSEKRINSVTPTGDLNKHKVSISTSMSPVGDPNKHKSIISISNCISLLYECMKILIYVIVICLL